MTKKFLWAVTALALLPGVAERTMAQTAGTTESAGEAAASSEGESVSETATSAGSDQSDSVSATATGQADAQSPSTPLPPDAPPAAGAPLADAQAAGSANVDADASAQPLPGTDAAGNATLEGTAQGEAGLGAPTTAPQAQANAANANISAGVQFGQPTDRGLTLNQVAAESFLYRSGLRPGDVIVSYGGQPIRNQAEFSRWAVYQPGQRIPIVVLRDGREETIFVTYDRADAAPVQRQAGYVPQAGGAYLGVTFDAQSQQGAVVRSVAPGSPAENAGIAPGQIIVTINDRRVSNYQDVINYVAALQPGQEVDLIVAHRVTLGARPGQANYSAPPSGVAVESSVIRQAPLPPAPVGVVPAPVGVVPATRLEEGPVVVRPGDADRDGRVLDGDGRIGPRERAGRR